MESLPINSLRLTRLSTSVKDVELWSEASALASSRSVKHKIVVGDWVRAVWRITVHTQNMSKTETFHTGHHLMHVYSSEAQPVGVWCVSDNTHNVNLETTSQRFAQTSHTQWLEGWMLPYV